MTTVARDITSVFESDNGPLLYVPRDMRIPESVRAFEFEFEFDIAIPQRPVWKWYDFLQPIVYCRLDDKTRMFWDWLRYEMEHKYIPIETVICEMLTSAESAYWIDMIHLRIILLPAEFGSQ